MKSAICKSLFALTVLVVPFAAAAADWKTESYNPAPLEGDLILPMPCGGAMAFRKVQVPSTGLLDDQRFTMGTLEEEQAYAEFRRNAWLAGSFSDRTDENSRFYYMGKYEVSKMQFQALSGTCPDPADADLEMPVTRVSWAEAALFAEGYSDWLLKNRKDAVPFEDGAPGFLRLPTEAEWEYAARGGSKVSPSAFSDRLPFPQKDLDAHVIHDGNSYRELNLIGTRASNPLGIHDMLGNAAEMTIDPFRLNVVTRLHGRAGGFALRGGSYRTRPTEVRTSDREEFPPVDERGIRRPDTAGFRLVMTAPALPSRASIDTVRKDWEKLPQENEAPSNTGKLADEQADPVKEARALADATADAEVKRRLENLSVVIAESIRTRNEQRDRAARELLSNAVFAARRVTTDIRIVDRWAQLARSTGDADRRSRYEKNRDEDQQVLDFNLGYYMDRLTTIAGEYGPATLSSQAGALKAGYRARGLTTLPPLTDGVLAHVEAVRTSGTQARDDVLTSLKQLAKAAEE
ncbi:formylglycine-generating enzyme family protein [Minwuia sp.]|uniref:formylglycine-generating enzyme family protein n=1 Tax=Minwuia sp. TaxID=2493630 RepID=UPI003A91538A